MSPKENYKNEINESTIFDCGVLEGECFNLMELICGSQIIDRCNITSNRVSKHIGGYSMQAISSDSFIKYTTIRSNNQSTSDSFGLCLHTSLNDDKLISAISCSYVENRQLNPDGRLIVTATKISMFDCCILSNEFTYIFYLISQGSINFNNSFADKYSATSVANSVEYFNTFSSSECKYYYVDIIENENKVNNKDEEDDSDDNEKVKQIV